MKLKNIVLTALAALVLSFPITAESGSGHSHSHGKKESGPNGGRLLTKIEPRAEFFVTSERKIQITFVDEHGQAVAPAEQVVTVITGERSAPVTLTFSKSGNVLLSTAALPSGNDLPTVVQIKSTPDAKAIVERFNLNMAICSGCSKGEYACTCGH